MNGTILIYGATGYTGKLIAKAAADQGARPILAGRNLAKVNAVARPLGLKARAFDLGDRTRRDAANQGRFHDALRRRRSGRSLGRLGSSSRSLGWDTCKAS